MKALESVQWCFGNFNHIELLGIILQKNMRWKSVQRIYAFTLCTRTWSSSLGSLSERFIVIFGVHGLSFLIAVMSHNMLLEIDLEMDVGCFPCSQLLSNFFLIEHGLEE